MSLNLRKRMGLTEKPGMVAGIPVSVVVLTRNEELNIEECLRSAAWAGEVFVVDSLSDDGTAEIAKGAGAVVFRHRFEGYAAQRNWALDNLPFSNEWVLMLDADELTPVTLATEIARVVRNEGNNCAGFYLKRRFIFLGRWLRHGGLYPTWILRLFRRQCVRFEERPLNEHAILSGKAGYLSCPFDHCDNRPLSDWVAKHNRYANLEAEQYLQEKAHDGRTTTVAPRWWGTQVERKRWIKLHIWNRLPLLVRPFLFFVRNYVVKGGFLDARAGFVYHVLWSFWYPFLVSAKIIERGYSASPSRLHSPRGIFAASPPEASALCAKERRSLR